VKTYGDAFARDLGRLTEHYVGRQLSSLTGVEIHPEILYGKPQKKSIDWFLLFDEVIVLVEVKSMRATVDLRAASSNAIDTIAYRLDAAMRQIRSTNSEIEALNPAFGHIPSDQPRIGIVVTAEPFYTANSQFMREKMNTCPIPTIIASLREIEHIVCIDPADLEGRLVAVVHDPERSTWNLSSSIPPSPGESPHNPILEAAFRQYRWPDTERVAAPSSPSEPTTRTTS